MHLSAHQFLFGFIEDVQLSFLGTERRRTCRRSNAFDQRTLISSRSAVAILVCASSRRFFSSSSGSELTALVNRLVVSFNRLIARSCASPSIPYRRNSAMVISHAGQQANHVRFEPSDFLFRLTVALQVFLYRFGHFREWTVRNNRDAESTIDASLLSLLLFPELIGRNQVVRALLGRMAAVVRGGRFVDFFELDAIQFEILDARKALRRVARYRTHTKTS